jgi:hypothetical protein
MTSADAERQRLERLRLEHLAQDELAQVATRAGCRVLARSRLEMGDGTTVPVLELECGDNARAIAFLNAAADHDTGDADVRDLALRILQAHPGDRFPAAVHTFVKLVLRFVRERRETFQHTKYTLRRGAGDCDDHARCVTALVRAGGGKAQIVGVRNARGEVSHVAPLVWDRGGWRWAETTVNASYGEHPHAAAKRLGVTKQRADL